MVLNNGNRFDPSWYLISRIAEPRVDIALENSAKGKASSMPRLSEIRHAIQASSTQPPDALRSVFINPKLVETKTERIAETSTYLSRYPIGGRNVLLDSTTSTGAASYAAGKAHIRDLARILSHADPMSFGLLKCEGVLERNTNGDSHFQLIFEIPNGLDTPKTMRDLLITVSVCSLSKRVQLATQLARSVMFVHTTGFVHKGIRPETILIFSQKDEDIGPSLLIGFEQVRRAEAQTSFLSDLEWERNLYRHPVRQGLWSEEMFTMQHDIYSLGVCLLELALRQTFVCLEGDITTPWAELDMNMVIDYKDARRREFAIKKKLVAIAKERLPHLVGDRYTSVVIACLCCLDKGDDNVFQMDDVGMKNKDGTTIGVRYIENVSLLCDCHSHFTYQSGRFFSNSRNCVFDTLRRLCTGPQGSL
ncbi:unnamed protein product [Penicillium salamii]|nr:unnamed protein product [Penicillium salamii]CAG8396495.1 unnamed protein product [Penicillium salamii]